MQLICHIGQPKTASTAIQALLDRNREWLAGQGLLYPKSVGAPKSALVPSFAACKSDPRLSAICDKIRHNLEAEMSEGHSKMLFSEERLFNLRIARDILDCFGLYAESWRILCYVRRPDDHIVSLYNEHMRAGRSYTLQEYFDNVLHSKYYYYADRIEQWAEVFGKDAVEVRVFHRDARQGRIFEDFIQWVGVGTKGLSLAQDDYANRSLDRLNTEILRLLNLCRIQRPDLLRKHNVFSCNGSEYKLVGSILDRLQTRDTGDRLRLDTEHSRRLLGHVREDNERLAERYLSPEHAAALLAPPADLPPLPPLDENALFQRMMDLFDDPDLAGLALDYIKS